MPKQPYHTSQHSIATARDPPAVALLASSHGAPGYQIDNSDASFIARWQCLPGLCLFSYLLRHSFGLSSVQNGTVNMQGRATGQVGVAGGLVGSAGRSTNGMRRFPWHIIFGATALSPLKWMQTGRHGGNRLVSVRGCLFSGKTNYMFITEVEKGVCNKSSALEKHLPISFSWLLLLVLNERRCKLVRLK